ncbi:hypothetical protein ElyMa_005852000 [Elysia marginata]|uniref:Uncharacterized protein n=1 Tax=Elysia marginata TaxID=1093978 RepID=A0AAV4FZL6_9GAST|nr:hypothetical protein ElyMa_005852000 [Elysia marginata]
MTGDATLYKNDSAWSNLMRPVQLFVLHVLLGDKREGAARHLTANYSPLPSDGTARLSWVSLDHTRQDHKKESVQEPLEQRTDIRPTLRTSAIRVRESRAAPREEPVVRRQQDLLQGVPSFSWLADEIPP